MVLAVEKPVRVAYPNIRTRVEPELADGADDAGRMEKAGTDLRTEVIGFEVNFASRTPRPESSVVISFAEESFFAVREAGRVEVVAAVETAEAFAVKGSQVLDLVLVLNVEDEVVGDWRLTFCTTTRHCESVVVDFFRNRNNVFQLGFVAL